MRVSWLYAVLWAAACCLAGPSAWAEPTFPARSAYVVDAANILPPQSEAALSARLADLEARATRQVVVVTVTDMGDLPISEYANQLVRAWGRSGRNWGGVLLLVAPRERQARIVVGETMRGLLPAAATDRIIHERLLPRFAQGAFDVGIHNAVDAIILPLLGAELKWQGATASPRQTTDRDGRITTTFDTAPPESDATASQIWWNQNPQDWLKAGGGATAIVLYMVLFAWINARNGRPWFYSRRKPRHGGEERWDSRRGDGYGPIERFRWHMPGVAAFAPAPGVALGDDDKRRVSTATYALDDRTSADVLVVVAKRGGPYGAVAFLVALPFAALAAYLGPFFRPGPPIVQAAMFAAMTVMALTILFSLIGVHRITPPALKRRWARHSARREFSRLKSAQTTERPALLIYLGLAEGHIELVADDRVANAIGAVNWQQIADNFAGLAEALGTAGALSDMLQRSGKLLAAKFPAAAAPTLWPQTH